MNYLYILPTVCPYEISANNLFYYFICKYLANKMLIYLYKFSAYFDMNGREPYKFFLNFSVFLIELPIFNCKFFNFILLLMVKRGPTFALSSIIPLF